MIEWIAKYWLEVVFGLICAGVSFSVRHHYKLIAENRKIKQEKLDSTLAKKFEDQSNAIKEQMKECYAELIHTIDERDKQLLEADVEIHSEIDALRDGMLSLQGREFKADCRYLLNEGHIITLNEYESIIEEHRIYNSLGGNHEGDALFSMVKAKYEQSLALRMNK